VAEVLASSGLSRQPPLVDIDSAEVVAHIDALPWVKSAAVSEHWPDSVTVVVTERSPLAAVAPSAGQTGTWVLVDGTGRVLADRRSRPLGLLALSVPVVPGTPGTSLAAADEPAVEIAISRPALVAARVNFVDVASDGDVTLALKDGLVAVFGPPTMLEAKYEALASVLAGATLASGDVIDVSVPDEPTVGPSSVPSTESSTASSGDRSTGDGVG
jgi:cell division protein FtsQ